LHDYRHYFIAILDEGKGMKEQDWMRIKTQHSAVKGRDLQQEMITVVLLLGKIEVDDGVASTASDILAQGVTLRSIEKVDSKSTREEYGDIYSELCSSFNQLII